MQRSRVHSLPDPLPQVLTSLPVFFLLEFLGRNPGTWESAAGLAQRVGITEREATDALETLVRHGLLTCRQAATGDPIYRLSTESSVRDKVIRMADQINRSRGEFLAFVREILRRQMERPHA